MSMRIAVLGLGFMGSTHVKAWRRIAEAKLAAVYSSDEQKLSGDLSAIEGNLGTKGEAFDFTAVRKYHDIPELLNDPDIDAVDICLPLTCTTQPPWLHLVPVSTSWSKSLSLSTANQRTNSLPKRTRPGRS